MIDWRTNYSIHGKSLHLSVNREFCTEFLERGSISLLPPWRRNPLSFACSYDAKEDGRRRSDETRVAASCLENPEHLLHGGLHDTPFLKGSLRRHLQNEPPLPKVSPPSVFAVIKGAMDGDGPVLSRTFGNEEIRRISVMRLANVIAGGGGEDDDNADVNQLFLNVEVSKPEQEKSLHFLCGLYPDSRGHHETEV